MISTLAGIFVVASAILALGTACDLWGRGMTLGESLAESRRCLRRAFITSAALTFLMGRSPLTWVTAAGAVGAVGVVLDQALRGVELVAEADEPGRVIADLLEALPASGLVLGAVAAMPTAGPIIAPAVGHRPAGAAGFTQMLGGDEDSDDEGDGEGHGDHHVQDKMRNEPLARGQKFARNEFFSGVTCLEVAP